MKLYVSGPMTGYPEYNFPLFNETAEALRDAGYTVDNPADHGIKDGWTWADYLRLDVRIVTEVDGVAVLPHWQESKGAVLEVHVAHALGIPVMPADKWVATASKA